MEIPVYWVDAFTVPSTARGAGRFTGNPAAVCPLDEWLDDASMQAIAFEHGLAETAFFVREGDGHRIRWFTPETEVDLCGHATLASAYVLFHEIEPDRSEVVFASRGGDLRVTRDGDLLSMVFPARRATPAAELRLAEALGAAPREVLACEGGSLMAVLGSDEEVRALAPRMPLLESLAARAVIVTAPGTESDFVSRFFAPKMGIPEDPVTGSAHCSLVPYWAARLGKKKLFGIQRSKRSGHVHAEDLGDRVRLAGCARPFLRGRVEL